MNPGKVLCVSNKNLKKEFLQDLRRQKYLRISFGRTEKWKKLYPKNIGVEDLSNPAVRLDNFWSGSLITDTDLFFKNKEITISPKFLNRQLKFFSSNKAKKPPKGGIPVGGYFNQEISSLIQARYIYCRKYQNLVTKLPEFKELYDLRSKGQNILITGNTAVLFEFDPDDDHKSAIDLLKSIFENNDIQLSNELILVSILCNLFFWNSDEDKENEDDTDEDDTDDEDDTEDDTDENNENDTD